MSEARCGNPIDSAALGDYWLAALTPAEEALVEEHLFGCDACGDRLRELIALAEAIRKLASQGALRVVISDSFLECAAAHGLRVRQYSPPAGGSVNCTVTANDDLLIGRLASDLSGAGRVDLALCDETGTEHGRLRDIPFSGSQREVIFNEPIERARASPANVFVVKLLAVDEAGDRLIGTYTFNHTPS